MASANGLLNNNLVVNTLDGLTTVYTSGGAIDPTLYVKYADNTNNTDLGTFDLQTLGTLSAKQHVLPLFGSTMMTSPTTSSIFYAHSWKLNNTVGISSLGSGNYLSTSYLTIRDVTNASTLLTLQSDGIADFADTKVRVSTMASNVYDVVNLSTLTSAVAFIFNVNALNYVPYTNALQNLNMGGSTITTLGQINAGALRITSSIANTDYRISVNTYDQLEFINLSNGSILKTNGSDLFVTGSVNCGTLGATNVEAGSNIYLAKGSTAEWRTKLGMSDEYEILDNAGIMRMRLSKTTGLTVSTLNITQVPSATPTLALGVNGGGQVVSFAVPTATNILPLANTFTGASNTFNNDVYLGTSTVVVNQQSITTSILQTAGISSQALGGTAVISGSYLLTPTPTTFAYASVYSPTQTFLANAKYNYLFTGFTAAIFGVSLTVYQANVANTGFVAISSTVPVVVGTFSGVFTPNSNSSYLGQVYFTFSGINSKTVGWTAFTYQRGMETVNGNLTVNGDTNTSTITASAITASGTITKNTSNPNSYMTIVGGNGFNSPVLESWFGSLRRGYIGNATASVFQLASENNCDFNLITGGSVRMTIDNAGITTIPSKELRVSNLTSASGGQIRLTWGTTGYGLMFYNDGGSFFILLTNNNDVNGNYNGLRPFYINESSGRVSMENGLDLVNTPQNTSLYSQVAVFDGNTLKKSQAVNKLVYFSNNVSWGGGVNTTYAFYLFNTTCSVYIWGKNSGYYSGAGMMQTMIRVYSQSAGTYYYYPFNAFVNVGNNHFTVPLNYATTFPYTGWYDIYVYSTSGWITDGNDQLTIGVSILPVKDF